MMGTKRIVTVYLDSILIERAKLHGFKLSSLLNSLLARYFELEDMKEAGRIKELREELRRLEAEKERRMKMAVLLERLQPYVEFYKKKEEEGWKEGPVFRRRWLEETAKKLGLTVKETEAYLKGARPVGQQGHQAGGGDQSTRSAPSQDRDE